MISKLFSQRISVILPCIMYIKRQSQTYIERIEYRYDYTLPMHWYFPFRIRYAIHKAKWFRFCPLIYQAAPKLSLQWRHNGRDGVSITGVSIVYSTVCSDADQRKHQSSASLEGNSPITSEFPSQWASNAENVSIWWRHHVAEEQSCLMKSYSLWQESYHNFGGLAPLRAVSAYIVCAYKNCYATGSKLLFIRSPLVYEHIQIFTNNNQNDRWGTYFGSFSIYIYIYIHIRIWQKHVCFGSWRV